MRYVIAAIFILIKVQCLAQDNFEPCSDSYSTLIWITENHVKKSKELFKVGKDEYISSSILIDPSLSNCNQYLATVKNYNTYEYRILLKYLCSVKSKIKVEEYSKALSKEEFLFIGNMFAVALFHLEYNPRTMQYADGTSYHLKSEFWGVSQDLCGFVHSPIRSGGVKDFIEIANELMAFVVSDEINIDQSLVDRIEEITLKMNVKKLNLQSPSMEVQMFGKDFEFFLK